MFSKKFSIKPNQLGYLYKNNIFQRKLSPGVYRIPSVFSELEVITLPETARFAYVTSQEALSKDNIAFRMSFIVIYSIKDGEKFLSNFELKLSSEMLLPQADMQLANLLQVALKEVVGSFDSEELTERRSELSKLAGDRIKDIEEKFGVKIVNVYIRDLTFPKNIQDLFAKQLESKIRAKVDLENARTAVATARAMKNAAELMKGDENIKFLQYLDTIVKISSQGKNTFVVGDSPLVGKAGK